MIPIHAECMGDSPEIQLLFTLLDVILLLLQEVLTRAIERGALGIFNQTSDLLRLKQSGASGSPSVSVSAARALSDSPREALDLHYPSLLCCAIAEEFGLPLPSTSVSHDGPGACLERLYAAAMCQRGVMDDDLAKELIQVGSKPYSDHGRTSNVLSRVQVLLVAQEPLSVGMLNKLGFGVEHLTAVKRYAF